MEEGMRALKILTGKLTENTSLLRRRRSWQDNIIMNLEEIGINTKNCVDSAQDSDFWSYQTQKYKVG